MQRIINQQFAEAIEFAFDLIPPTIKEKIDYVEFLTGTDPIFAGLHRFKDVKDGRSYCNAAHCAYPYHQTSLPSYLRRATIVLPVNKTPITIIHELGHVLDEVLEFKCDMLPVSKYAHTNREEAFAEAFTAFIIPHYAEIKSEQDMAIFRRLIYA